MCLLICLRGENGSLVIGANRDERYDRPARAPFVWQTRPRVLAGRDELAGGTWLAVNEHGLVAAVTNRPGDGGDDPARPSRGELPLLACRCRSAARARRRLGEKLRSSRYNGFNLLVADAAEAFVVQAPACPLRVEDVPAGPHVVANGAWDDLSDPRVDRALDLLPTAGLGAGTAPNADEAVAAVTAACRDHQLLPDGGTLCLHGPHGGTVSSTVLVIDADRRLASYLHAPGPPCRTAYRDLSAEVGLLGSGRPRRG